MATDRYLNKARVPFRVQTVLQYGFSSHTAAGNLTLTRQSSQMLKIDPGGAGRDVTLPADEDGLWFLVTNAADAPEDLTVKDAAGSTIVTISQNERALVICGASGWDHMGIETIALA